MGQLALKYKGVHKSILGLIADKIATKVTEEDQIEGAITDFETNSPISISDYATLLQQETDKRVTTALEKAAKKETKTDPKEGEGQQKPTDAEDMPAWAKAMMQQFQGITQTISGFQANSIRSELKAALKAKGIPETWADDVTISEGFNPAESVASLERKWNETKQIIINKEVEEGNVFRGYNSNTTLDAIKDFAKKTDLKEQGYNIQEI